MKVLFVGDWDFAGACMADLLLREGNEACWITNETEKALWNKRLHGKVYRGTFDAEEYGRILSANAIDTVILLTGALRETYLYAEPADVHTPDMAELLHGLENRRIKSLVYLSSVELEYTSDYTPALADLAAGEMRCRAFCDAYQIPFLVLRMGMVYGECAPEDMGYTGWALQRLMRAEEIVCPCAPADPIDAIYGKDAARAAFELMKLEKSGVYDIVTGHPMRLDEYFGHLADAVGTSPDIRWKKLRSTTNAECFDARPLKMQTGWFAHILLDEKGKTLLHEYLQQPAQEQQDLPVRRNRVWQRLKQAASKKSVRQVAEILLLFAVNCLLLYFESDMADLKYVDIRLLFVALVACLYGSRAATLAVVLASGSYIYTLATSYVDVSYLLYSVDTWVPFVIYLITGVTIGYAVDRWKDEIASVKEAKQRLQEQYDFLQSIHKETLEAKSRLQKQIINSKHSLAHIYQMEEELDSLEPERILRRVITILQNIMECDKTAIFLAEESKPDCLRLKACSKTINGAVPERIDISDKEAVRLAFKAADIFVNTDLQPDCPDYAAPIYFENRLYAVVVIYEIDPEKFTLYYQNLFKIITGVIEKNLVKALQYEQAERQRRCILDTALLKPQELEQEYEMLCRQQDSTVMRALVFPRTEKSVQEMSEQMTDLIHWKDRIGVDGEGRYCVLFVDAEPEDIQEIKARFAQKELTLEVMP